MQLLHINLSKIQEMYLKSAFCLTDPLMQTYIIYRIYAVTKYCIFFVLTVYSSDRHFPLTPSLKVSTTKSEKEIKWIDRIVD
jgi:hypothetical protein